MKMLMHPDPDHLLEVIVRVAKTLGAEIWRRFFVTN